MGAVLDLAEDLWTGARTTVEHNPLTTFLGLEVLSEDTAFICSLANVTAFATDEGLVLVDTGSFISAASIRATVRQFSDAPVHTAVFTHGHVDHVFGAAEFDREAIERGWSRPRVVSHEAVPQRFDRYQLTAGYNSAINARQFRLPGLRWPTDYRYPDETFRTQLSLSVGGLKLELFHDRGETDDHAWVWVPERKVLCTGDLFIWASPNCGNPQKVQRYPREWALALDKMATLGAETLLPGHGPPILGADRVEQALRETAELLHLVHDRTVALMNDGLSLDAVVQAVEIPKRLMERPYLRPVYDEPGFIVRNIWRLYGGWYDGNPARLAPAPDAAIGAEVVALAGGVSKLLSRARQLLDNGQLAEACQLAEWAWQVSPGNREVCDARREIYRTRAEQSSSLMATSIYRAASEESRDAE